MRGKEKLQYEKPCIEAVRIVPEECAYPVSAQRSEAASSTGESCYKICWDKSRDSNRMSTGVSSK